MTFLSEVRVFFLELNMSTKWILTYAGADKVTTNSGSLVFETSH